MSTKRTELEGTRKVPLLFDPESMGRSLKEVAVDVVPVHEAHYISRWFHSPNDIDLFIWTDEKKNIIRQQVSFCGQVVEWNVVDGVKTGLIVEQELSGDKENANESIQFDSLPQSRAVFQAVSLLAYVPDLADRERGHLIELLKKNPNSRHVNLEVVSQLQRDLSKSARPSFWKRVKGWFSGGK